MKVLLLNGSPNARGCTWTALNEVKKGLEAQGVEGEIVHVCAEDVPGCTGCFACGDLAGKPYQYIKAAGQGNVAALSAVEWLAKQKK